MRSQTPESPSWFGRKTLLIAAGGIGVAAAVLALTLRSTSPLPDTSAEIATPSFGEAPLSDAPMVAEMTSDTPASGHPVYRHSVVAGGVHDVDEVRRAVADPVVREHYASVSMDKLKVVATPARRDAHMSYRIGDRIYWTKKKIALSAGEAVLTDGETTIRARCGNLVSDEAMLPTSDEEPPASAFDAVEPRGNGAPVAGNANTALADGLLARSGGGAASVYPGLSAGAFGQQGNDRNDQQGVGGFSSGNLGGSAGSVGGGAGSRRPVQAAAATVR